MAFSLTSPRIRRWIQLARERVAFLPWQARAELLNEYVDAAPSAQNAVDAVPGWNHAFPPEVDVRAGEAHLYYDPRILWCIEQFGDVSGRSILELGPLEASHTSMFDRRGASFIHAVEGNRQSFLRCLVAKELLGLTRASFFLGNFMLWLERPGLHYDLAVASGVLYHMRDPVGLLDRLARCTHAIYLWTHYFDEAAMPPGDRRRVPFDGAVETRLVGDVPVRLHRRSYLKSWIDRRFCGGMYDAHYWLEKEQIIAVLRKLGFDEIRVAHDDPSHIGGPCCSIFARRNPPAA